jgi:hypothetical protein
VEPDLKHLLLPPTAIALGITAVALAVFSFTLNSTVRQQRIQIRSLQAKIDKIPKSAPLELQSKCAQRAQRAFVEQGWDSFGDAEFSNHYNMELGRCFVKMERSRKISVKGNDSTLEMKMVLMPSSAKPTRNTAAGSVVSCHRTVT